MRISKVKNFSKNLLYGSIAKVIALFFPFIIRTVMVRKLGTEYLGISSLFSAILQALNLVELGMGGALVFNMYGPVSENDKNKLGQFLHFYKKCYRIIGTIILVCGLFLLPFLDRLINGSYPKDINIHIIYLIYLINTVLTYWLFAYKNSIALAYQRTDIESKTLIISQTGLYIIQIIALVLIKNYYWYIIWLPVATVIKNIIVSIRVDKEFKDIKAVGKLDSNEVKSVFSNMKALFGHQVAFTVINSADSIILSAIIGLNELTIYNNYYYVISALTALLTIFFSSIQAGIGNSIVLDSEEDVFKTFKRFRFVTYFCVEGAAIILFGLFNPFMKVWMGENLMLNPLAVLIFITGFYVTQIRRAVTTYKNAAGLWSPDLIKPYIVIAVDVLIDLYLIKQIGSIGAMISTIISMGFIAIPWETVVLYKHIFKKSPVENIVFMLKETVLFAVSIFIANIVSSFIRIDGFVGLLVRFVVFALLAMILCITMHFYLEEYKWAIGRTKAFLRNKA